MLIGSKIDSILIKTDAIILYFDDIRIIVFVCRYLDGTAFYLLEDAVFDRVFD